MTKYKTEFANYQQTIKIPSNCNVITFVNNSTTVSFNVNNFPVLPGASFSVAGNEGEIDETEYNIDFGTTTTGSCWVIKKINQ